ncbi:hypothetical protein AUE96_004951 [Escherichia coli]|nr:hypothetical protein [Escherichia coli]
MKAQGEAKSAICGTKVQYYITLHFFGALKKKSKSVEVHTKVRVSQNSRTASRSFSDQPMTADGESSSLSSSAGTPRAPSSTLRAVRAAFRRPPLPLLHPARWRRLNDLPTQKLLHKKSTFHAKHEALFLICVLS